MNITSKPAHVKPATAAAASGAFACRVRESSERRDTRSSPDVATGKLGGVRHALTLCVPSRAAPKAYGFAECCVEDGVASQKSDRKMRRVWHSRIGVGTGDRNPPHLSWVWAPKSRPAALQQSHETRGSGLRCEAVWNCGGRRTIVRPWRWLPRYSGNPADWSGASTLGHCLLSQRTPCESECAAQHPSRERHQHGFGLGSRTPSRRPGPRIRVKSCEMDAVEACLDAAQHQSHEAARARG